MSNLWCNSTLPSSALKSSRWAIVVFGALLATGASPASADNLSVVRDLASRVGPIIGSALACQNIARPRVQVIVDKFQAVIREASTSGSERDEVSRLFDRYVADGRGAVTTGRLDCRGADHQLAELEQSIAGASPQPSQPPAAAAAAASAGSA
ncbi:MAG: ABC transporter substrate-binding protein, partial [Bradyrhizobium sp.]